jgi:4-amino-4-deoxy-L-arabinose transferase-like glycosyltransferase
MKLSLPAKKDSFWSSAKFIVSLAVIANLVWSFFDHGLPDWDASDHLLNGLQYVDLLKHPKIFDGGWWHSFLSVNFFYPPAVYIFTGAVKIILGTKLWVDALVKAFFIFVFSLSTYKIAEQLLHDRRVAALAVLVINLYPESAFWGHTSMLDLPLAAMVLLALWSLVSWTKNPGWRQTVVLAFSLAAACMTKQIGACYLLVPCLMVLAQSAFARNWSNVGKLVAAGLVTPLAALPWLLVNAKSTQDYIAFSHATYVGKGLSWSFADVLSYYVTGLQNICSPGLLLLFVVAVFACRPKVHKDLALVIASSVGGFILVSTITWTFPLDRYLIPALLLPAIYSANFIVQLLDSQKLIAKLGVCAIAFYATMQYLLLNFSPYPISLPADWQKQLGLSVRNCKTVIAKTNPQSLQEDWGQSFVLSTIAETDPGLPVWLNVLPNMPQLNVHTFEYLGKLEKSYVRPSTLRSWSLGGDTNVFSPEQALNFHWYVMKTGNPGFTFFDEKNKRDFEALTQFVQASGKYRLVGEKPLPDGSTLLLYRLQ